MFIYQVSRLRSMRVTRRIVLTLLTKALYKFGCFKEKVWSFLKFWIWQCCYFTELPWHVFARWQLTQVSKKGAEIDKEEEKVNLNFPHGWSYWKSLLLHSARRKSRPVKRPSIPLAYRAKGVKKVLKLKANIQYGGKSCYFSQFIINYE